LIWRVAIDSRTFGTFDQIAAWSLDRVIAANDLIDALAQAEHDAREKARAENK
jgi:hypothetical protein